MHLLRAALVLAYVAALAWLALALWPRPALACSCLETEATDSIESADVIFEGSVSGPAERAEVDVWDVGYFGALRFEFEVARYYKGEGGSKLPVFTIDQETACGRQYGQGTYLVYARYQDEGLLTDSSCSRTRPVGDATEDLALLGSGELPAELPMEPADTAVAGCALSTERGTNGVATVTLLGLALLAWRRQGRAAARAHSKRMSSICR